MACKKCSEVEASLQSGNPDVFQKKTVKCSYCDGAGHVVDVVVVVGVLVGQDTDCRHCKGTGWCELKDMKYWEPRSSTIAI